MNSADKKAPEPSMDDIISSIRNIIADDTPESTPVAAPAAVASAQPAVVQLTEQQIAEPVSQQTAVDVKTMPVPEADETPSAIVPAANDPSTEAMIANEFDAVPGAGIALESPVVPSAQMEGGDDVQSPVAKVVQSTERIEAVDVAPAPVAAAPTETNATATPIDVPVGAGEVAPAHATPFVESAASLPDPVAAPPVSAMEPVKTVLESPSIPTPEPIVTIADPLEQMIQESPVETGNIDGINNGIDPDQILDGMSAGEAAAPALENITPTPEPSPELSPALIVEPVVEAETKLAPPIKDEPVVLDASQVTPEDAIAITAVAAATSEAMTGQDEPDQKHGGNSLEDSVKAMLKPMIREWLDDNMPRILEGAVKEEVKSSEGDET